MRCLRLADEAHAPRRQIVEPADIIVDRAIARRRQRIDGEIAPLGVGLPVAAEGDLGVAAIGFHVAAQRRHLEGMVVDDDGDGAMLDAGRHRLEAGGLHAPHHFLRHRGGGEVDLMNGDADQRIAHRAADHARLLAVAVEHGDEPRQRAACSQAACSSLRSVRPCVTGSAPARICRSRYARARSVEPGGAPV